VVIVSGGWEVANEVAGAWCFYWDVEEWTQNR